MIKRLRFRSAYRTSWSAQSSARTSSIRFKAASFVMPPVASGSMSARQIPFVPESTVTDAVFNISPSFDSSVCAPLGLLRKSPDQFSAHFFEQRFGGANTRVFVEHRPFVFDADKAVVSRRHNDLQHAAIIGMGLVS